MLTGPSFHLMGKDVVSRFRQDIEDLEIPLIASRVVKIGFEGPVKTVQTESGQTFRVLSVIIATGSRSLCNEQDYLQNIAITYMGYEFFEELLNNFFNMEGQQTVVIVGNEFTRNLVELIESCNRAGHSVIYLLDSSAEKPQMPIAASTILQGKILRYEGQDALEGVRAIIKGEGERFISCRKVLLDYNSYELSPLYEFNASPLKKDRRGFIAVDREMRTSIDRVYAAGDITGLYATVGRAIGDGIVAGFSAYKDIFKIKFNQEPCLFAYAANDVKITPGFKDIPKPGLHLRPKILVSSERAILYADEYCSKTGIKPDDMQGSLAMCTGIKTIAEIISAGSIKEPELFDVIEFLLTKKALALHL
jgi:thioredoxin reductase